MNVFEGEFAVRDGGEIFDPVGDGELRDGELIGHWQTPGEDTIIIPPIAARKIGRDAKKAQNLYCFAGVSSAGAFRSMLSLLRHKENN